MKKKLFLMGILGAVLVFGIMTFVGCDSLLHTCSNQSECNDGDYTYCGDSGCESSKYYTVGGKDYYYTCDGVCDGD
ncbi:MAG: hypothetical protein LBH75_09340 [Treponema sp.]|nr:hypothetical protein [Treponema sp.]